MFVHQFIGIHCLRRCAFSSVCTLSLCAVRMSCVRPNYCTTYNALNVDVVDCLLSLYRYVSVLILSIRYNVASVTFVLLLNYKNGLLSALPNGIDSVQCTLYVACLLNIRLQVDE